MSSSQDCIFCKIIEGEIPSFKVYEDDDTLAFMDINPASDGHALVVPKAHAKDVHAITDESISQTVVAAKKVAAAVEKTVTPGGINLVQCNGPAAGQSVFHFHMHVLPRREGDDLKLNWGLRPGDMDAIGELAEKIKKNIE